MLKYGHSVIVKQEANEVHKNKRQNRTTTEQAVYLSKSPVRKSYKKPQSSNNDELGVVERLYASKARTDAAIDEARRDKLERDTLQSRMPFLMADQN